MVRRLLPVVGVIGGALLLAGCEPSEVAEPPPRPVMVGHPQPAGEAWATFPGEVRARHEPALAFRIGGKVVERLVEAGEHVSEGQVLARLDAADVRFQLESARAQLAAAQANLRVAKAERERYRTLLDRQLVSRSQFDNADNQFRSASARVEQAQADLNTARNQVEYAELRAPSDGVIVERSVEAGQVVGAGQTVMVLAVDGEREVAIDLPEQHLGDYRIGQPVELTLWSRPGERFKGHVREISPAADPVTRTYAARVAFDDTSVGAELGQSAQVLAPRDERTATLSVPLSALTAEAERAFVWRVSPEGVLERASVRVGAYGAERVPVFEGLAADDWVVLAGVHTLHEGQRVRAVDRDNRPVLTAVEDDRP